MRLRYDKDIPKDSLPLILEGPNGLRIEFHVRPNNDDTYTLLILSGETTAEPAKKVVQRGPYHLIDQAIAAKRAIVAELKSLGCAVAENQQDYWAFDVQRSISASRQIKAEAEVDYAFNPKDVFLDW